LGEAGVGCRSVGTVTESPTYPKFPIAVAKRRMKKYLKHKRNLSRDDSNDAPADANSSVKDLLKIAVSISNESGNYLRADNKFHAKDVNLQTIVRGKHEKWKLRETLGSDEKLRYSIMSLEYGIIPSVLITPGTFLSAANLGRTGTGVTQKNSSGNVLY
jgi:hypothetical protein